MRDKKPLNDAAILQIQDWLVENTEKGTLSGTDFREKFGDIYEFNSISNRIRRDIIDVCTTGKGLYVVLLWMLRPFHFGDIQSGDSYLDHIRSLESLREVTPLQQFWVHRVALIFVLSKGTSMDYAHRSLGDVIDFSTKSEAALDALVGMKLGSTDESLAMSALDKWYNSTEGYLSVRAIYQESSQIRTAMKDLTNANSKKEKLGDLPADLI